MVDVEVDLRPVEVVVGLPATAAVAVAELSVVLAVPDPRPELEA